MHKEAKKRTEEKLRGYYHSLVRLESLNNRLKLLERMKQETEGDIRDIEETDELKASLTDINSRILKLRCEIRRIEKDYAEIRYLVLNLPEREQEILKGCYRYRQKRSLRSLGYQFYLSESRVCQIKGQILSELYENMSHES